MEMFHLDFLTKSFKLMYENTPPLVIAALQPSLFIMQ